MEVHLHAERSSIRPGRKRRDPTELSQKEARFVVEYLVDLNGAAAMNRAGYKHTTSAAVGASKLLKLPKIATAIAEGQRRRLEETKITADRVLEELAAVAFADPRGLFDANWTVLPAANWPADLRKTVSSIDTSSGSVVRLRFWDKLAALGLLAKHLNLLKQETIAGELVVRWLDSSDPT